MDENQRREGIILFGEHFGEKHEHGFLRRCIDLSESFNKPCFINRSDLVENDLSVFALKAAWDAGGIGIALRGHRRNDHGGDMLIHFIGGYDEAGPHFLDLPANR